MIIPAPVLRSRSFFDRLRVFSPAPKFFFSKKGRLLPNLNKFLFPPHKSSLEKIHLFTSTRYLLNTGTEYLYRYTVHRYPNQQQNASLRSCSFLFHLGRSRSRTFILNPAKMTRHRLRHCNTACTLSYIWKKILHGIPGSMVHAIFSILPLTVPYLILVNAGSKLTLPDLMAVKNSCCSFKSYRYPVLWSRSILALLRL